MRSVFNRVTIVLMLLTGTADALYHLEFRFRSTEALLPLAIGFAASLVGSAIGAGTFALVKRIWQPVWYMRLVSSVASTAITAAVCFFALWLTVIYVDRLPKTTDAPVAMLAFFAMSILIGSASIVSALVVGAGAAAAPPTGATKA
jgi:hypothetical protein